MDALVASYPGVFPQGRAEAPEEGHPEGGEGDDAEGAEDAPDAFSQKWGWLALVDTVSETLRCPWDDVWRQTMVETLNIFCYTKDRNARREDALERYRKTH